MLIDHHLHFTNKSEISRLIKKYDLEKAIVFTNRVDKNLPNPYKKGNQRVLKFAFRNKRVVPFMYIHPFLDDIDYIKKESKNFFGFKLNCNSKLTGYSYTDLKKSKPFKIILKTKKPIIFHTGYKKGHKITDILPNLDDNKNAIVVFAHAGRFIKKDLEESSKYKNAFIDISPLNVISDNPRFICKRSSMKREILTKDFSKVIKFLIKYFHGRIVWGSDFPSCEELSKEGYSGELKIFNLLIKEGENNSFLD